MGPDTECLDLESYLETQKKIAEDHERIGNAFAQKMIQELKDSDPDFSQTVDENLWDLI